MMLEEAQSLLKKTTINQDDLDNLNSLYILLDLHKVDFCKIVDAVGLEKLLERRPHYKRLDRAEQELTAKENYLAAKERLECLEEEKDTLQNIVLNYQREARL